MTEEHVVSALYTLFEKRGHHLLVHNTTQLLHYVGESDFITVNKSGFVTEVEVKVSRADFKNDFTKKKRHAHLSGKGYTRVRIIHTEQRRYLDIPIVRKTVTGQEYTTKTSWVIDCVEHEEVYQKPSESIPNYFYYAYPEGMMQTDEVPDYCGILEIKEHLNHDGTFRYFTANEIRKPKRLHTRKPNDKEKVSLLRTQMYRVMNDSKRPFKVK